MILKMKADTLLKEFKTVEYSWLTKKAPLRRRVTASAFEDSLQGLVHGVFG